VAAHRHQAAPAPGEAAIAAQMALKPLYDRLSALLGQAAGLLLLMAAGPDPERERLHLISMRAQYAAARDALRGAPPTTALPGSRLALERTLPLLGEIIEALDRRQPAAEDRWQPLLGRLLAARRLLLAGSAPRLGIGLVDVTGACCAGPH
jgi:hypothetical protein